jgi:hypothetical protein
MVQGAPAKGFFDKVRRFIVESQKQNIPSGTEYTGEVQL